MICLSAEERVGKRERSGPCKLRAPPTPAFRDFMWNTFYLIFQDFFRIISIFWLCWLSLCHAPSSLNFQPGGRKRCSFQFSIWQPHPSSDNLAPWRLSEDWIVHWSFFKGGKFWAPEKKSEIDMPQTEKRCSFQFSIRQPHSCFENLTPWLLSED